jgi:hypothetical protein
MGQDKAKVVYMSDKNEAIVDSVQLVDGTWRFLSNSPLSGDRVLGKSKYAHAESLLKNAKLWAQIERENS